MTTNKKYAVICLPPISPTQKSSPAAIAQIEVHLPSAWERSEWKIYAQKGKMGKTISNEVLAPIEHRDHQHITENRRGGFDRDAVKKKRDAVAGSKPLEGLVALADDEPQREKQV
jgi:hypothetical protein